jgi:octaprenyl-diphosphate synthase
MVLLAGGNPQLTRRLADELADVEARFTAELLSDLPAVNTLVEHTERYRGKMLRPMLLLTSGLAVADDGLTLTDAHRAIAAVVEMVHMATLVHDDVLDEADVRRGGATINRLRGNEAAVMLGDYLISHAYHLCGSINRPDVARLIARTTNTVCEGELLQLANRDNWDIDEATYDQIIWRKTASLTGACCRLGAMLHGLDDQRADALRTYGERMGMAFQIIDDVLDLVGHPDVVGKSLRLDLHKGKLTLPLIRGLALADAADRRELSRWLQQAAEAGRGNQPADARQALARVGDLLTRLGAVDAARHKAAELVAEAKSDLLLLPDQPPRTLLADMADAVLERSY